MIGFSNVDLRLVGCYRIGEKLQSEVMAEDEPRDDYRLSWVGRPLARSLASRLFTENAVGWAATPVWVVRRGQVDVARSMEPGSCVLLLRLGVCLGAGARTRWALRCICWVLRVGIKPRRWKFGRFARG
jgi:hypothetical protein